jgi:hypothetical protein
MPFSGKTPRLVHTSDRRDNARNICMENPFTLRASIFATVVVSSAPKPTPLFAHLRHRKTGTEEVVS